MIYPRIDFNSFQNAFDRYGRSEQFSYTGLEMLFDYLWDLSEDTGQDIELDVVALCSQYAEYTKEEFLNYYTNDGIDSIEELELAIIDGDLGRVIDHDIDNDLILVNVDY